MMLKQVNQLLDPYIGVTNEGFLTPFPLCGILRLTCGKQGAPTDVGSDLMRGPGNGNNNISVLI